MSDLRFARKEIASPRLDGEFQAAPCLCLIRVMFGNPAPGDTQTLDAHGIAWEGPDYSVKEFAAYINRSPWALYKWLDPDGTAHFPAPDVFRLMAFIKEKSGGTDQRLALYVADLTGFAERVRKIINAVEGR